tara:strand:+ start:215 stop:3904 length:3690 start_codon:yes stop_codon:yes gene_type:complete
MAIPPVPRMNPKTAKKIIDALPENDLLYRTIWHEANGEGILGMALVANAIFNRKDILDQGAKLSLFLANDKSLKGVLTGKDQFQPVTGDQKVVSPISESQKKEVIEAIKLSSNKRLLENEIKEEMGGISNEDVLSLLNATGFRNLDAKPDKSQDINVVKFKKHNFNTAGNKNKKLVELEIDRNTPIPKEKPKSVIDFLKESLGISQMSLMGVAEAAEANPDGIPSSIPPKEDIGSMGEYSTYRSPNPTDQGTGVEKDPKNFNIDGISDAELKTQEFKNFIAKEVNRLGINKVIKETPESKKQDVLNIIKENLKSGPVVTPDSKEAIDEQMDKLLIDSDAMDKRERAILTSNIDPELISEVEDPPKTYDDLKDASKEDLTQQRSVGTADADNQDALLAGGKYTGYEFDEDIPTDNPDDLQDQSYPMGYDDPSMSLDDDQGGEYTGQDYSMDGTVPSYDETDTVVDREGMDYSEPEVVGDTSFFESLFTDVDTDYNFEVDDLNLEEGGSVEKEANFDGKEEEVEEEVKADPPPGAKPSEVADDIPAMLSEGEYVLPANVVRYLGLERIIDMHRQVLCEIQQMEDLGMIQNVDENGKPEEDDKEMQFAEDAPSAGAIEIIVASPKPKGIMSFGSGGAFEFDSGGAEGGMADYDSGFDTGFSSGDTGGSDGPDPADFNTFEISDYGNQNDNIFNRDEFGDDNPAQQLTSERVDEEGNLLVTEDFEKAAQDSDKVTSFEKDMEKIKEESPIGGKVIEGVMQMIGLGRVATAMEEFNNFMGEKRLEARNAAAEKARAEGKNEQEIQDAMNAAWASPGFSDAENAAFEGQFNEVSGYGSTDSKPFQNFLNLFKDILDGKKRDKDGYTIMDTGPMASYEGNKVKYNVEDPLNKYRGIRIPGTEGMTTIANEGFASGGLMQKKKFNQGGAYIEGVGYRDITQPMSLDSAFDTEVKTYEDVIAEMQGFTGRDKAPEQENLDRKQGKLRRQRSRELPYLRAGNPNPRISRKDPYLDMQLRDAGVDVEEFGDVIEAYREGKTQILPRSSPTGNRQLIKTLDNYTESKRMQYDGFTQKDLNNLPEDATNRDVLKKIFNTELQFRDGKFGYAGDEQDMANVGEEVGKAAPLGATGAPFRPMQGARFKEMYLEEFDPNNSKAIELKLDEKADIEQINRATSFLNTQGDEKYIDPNHPMYIDNIFREFNGFRGTGLWELDSKRDPLKTTSSALMGNQYVEGVGYR